MRYRQIGPCGVALLMVLFAAPVVASAQSVEIMFTPGVVQQAVSLKSSLKATNIDSFGALALVGASPERKKAYADKMAGMTALVILGEDALKVAADMEFACPVIVVNAIGQSPGAKKVVRVFDTAQAPPGAARPLSPAAVTEAIASNGMLKGDVSAAVQAIIGSLK